MSRVLAAAALTLAAVAAADATPDPRIADIHEGTNISVALSPDGRTLVTDLLGRIWRLPATGGGAEPMTPSGEAARYPRFSPDGRHIVYQRLVDGQWDLWLLDTATGARRALLASAFNERQPDFTADARSVVFASDRTGHYCLWSVALDTGVLTQLTAEPGDASFPAVSEFGDIAYVRHDGKRWSLRVLPAQGAAADIESGPDEISAPSWRPGGGVLVFDERDGSSGSDLKMLVSGETPAIKTLTHDEDVFTSRVAWEGPADFLYAADGRIWRRGIAAASRRNVPLIAAVSVAVHAPPPVAAALDAPGPNPVLGIAGEGASSDGRTRVFAALGDLWLAGTRAAPRRLTDDAYVDLDPSVAPDGRFAVFASDRGGAMDLWRIDLPSGTPRRLTHGGGKAYRPAVSPDGRRVAFLETRGFGPWNEAALRVVDLAPPGEARTLAADLTAPSAPRWMPGGRALEVETGDPAGPAPRVTVKIDASSGKRSYPAPPESDAAGAAASEADASAGGGESGELGAGLAWKPAAPAEPYVVQVGRLFDGVRGEYLRHVDIHIQGQRIVAISPRNVLPLPAKVIDERDATVIPGLIDIHVHESSLMGDRLGRIWLASGVTTVRELTEDIPGALERAESWASGRRLGPRVVVSGEPTAGDAEPSAAAPALPTPIPVRRFAALPVAYSLLRPGGPHGEDAALHPPPFAAADRRIDADALYRLRTSPLSLSYQDVLTTVVDSQTVITSDLAAALGPGAVPAKLRGLVGQGALARLYTPEERARWQAASPEANADAQALERNIAKLIRAGARVAAGSESPALPYGLGMHMELAMLAEAGIPNDQVLRIATAQNALALGLGAELGTLEQGKLADFLVVDGDPLQRLGDALNIIAVVKGGVWLDRARLLHGP